MNIFYANQTKHNVCNDGARHIIIMILLNLTCLFSRFDFGIALLSNQYLLFPFFFISICFVLYASRVIFFISGRWLFVLFAVAAVGFSAFFLLRSPLSDLVRVLCVWCVYYYCRFFFGCANICAAAAHFTDYYLCQRIFSNPCFRLVFYISFTVQLDKIQSSFVFIYIFVFIFSAGLCALNLLWRIIRAIYK